MVILVTVVVVLKVIDHSLITQLHLKLEMRYINSKARVQLFVYGKSMNAVAMNDKRRTVPSPSPSSTFSTRSSRSTASSVAP